MDIAGPGSLTPLPMGAGLLPIAEAVRTLPPGSRGVRGSMAPGCGPGGAPFLGDGTRKLAGLSRWGPPVSAGQFWPFAVAPEAPHEPRTFRLASSSMW